MRNKRGQEEIVGFVLIIVLLSVAFLIFLSIGARSPEIQERESIDVYQFLESSMEFTTDCSASSVDQYSLGDLFEECDSGIACLEGQSACETLNETLAEILDSSWNIDPQGSIKGYEFASTYNFSGINRKIISLEKGSCEGSFTGATYLLPRIRNEMRLCS